MTFLKVELEKFVKDAKIPDYKSQLGFLEIINKQTNEAINSRLYAYFINSQDKKIQSAFCQSLSKLIYQKSDRAFKFIGPEADTEVQTASGKGRIDIFIEDHSAKLNVIIENKIYHNLTNDLNDYWEHSKEVAQNKIGVLLTLNQLEIPKELEQKFINITHREWVELIRGEFTSDELCARTNIYLNDFITTVENFTNSYPMNEQTEFFFKNAEKVNQIAEIKIAGEQYIQGQLQLIADKLGLSQYGGTREWRNFWDEKKRLHTYLTLKLENIYNGRLEVSIIIELWDADIAKAEDLNLVLKDHPQFKQMRKDGAKDNSFYHYLCRDYNLLLEEMGDFSNVIVSKIRKDFGDIFIKCVHLNHPQYESHEWERYFALPQV
jgi:hypothetical protein